MGEPAQVAREACAAAHLHLADLGVGEEPVLRQCAPEQRKLGQPPEVPGPGPAHGTHPVPVAGEEGDEHFAQGQQRRLGQDPHEGEPRVALEHGAQLMAALQHLHGDGVAWVALDRDRQRLEAAGHRLAVADAGLGRHDHT